jgi:hypothetical protein
LNRHQSLLLVLVLWIQSHLLVRRILLAQSQMLKRRLLISWGLWHL